jgi:cytoskeletal protein RodZ
MEDLNEKMRERWQDRRKKGSNWPKLIVMILVLIAILIAMNLLNNASQKSAKAVETTLPPDQTPASSTDVQSTPEAEQSPNSEVKPSEGQNP